MTFVDDPTVVTSVLISSLGIPEEKIQDFEEMELADFSILVDCRGYVQYGSVKSCKTAF